jgi:hypothetical protein
MSEKIEKLRIAKRDILGELSREAIRASLSEEDINARANALAAKQASLLSSVEQLQGLFIEADYEHTSVFLGEDEDGAKYYARPYDVGRLRGIQFRAETSEAEKGAVIIKTDFFRLDGAYLDSAPVMLDIKDGAVSWQRSGTGRRSTDVSPDIYVLEMVERAYETTEDTLSMVWDAINNPVLNPELAERAAALQQA